MRGLAGFSHFFVSRPPQGVAQAPLRQAFKTANDIADVGFVSTKSVAFLLLLCGVCSGVESNKCFVCGEVLKNGFYWLTSPSLPDKVALCIPCHNCPGRCVVCQLPMRANARKLDDGRVLCDRDWKAAVFSPRDAEHIFREAQREVMAMLSGAGVLPDRNIAVSLVNGNELTRIRREKSGSDYALQGLTHTRMRGREFQHSVYLLNGLAATRLAAISAHEYAHTWLNENIPAARKLEGNTVEGFCELIAYKLMDQRHEELEKKVILANTYTQGQIHALIQAENNHQFARVLDWMKSGVDSSILGGETARSLAANKESVPELNWVQAPPTPVPDTLMLKGISGTSARRFALINDRTLTRNEQGRVRVGQTNLFLRCLEITDRSVLIQIKGSAARTELFLRDN